MEDRQHHHTHSDYAQTNRETRSLLVLTLVATSEEIASYEKHRHFIGACDLDGNTITERRLMQWVQDPLREYYCIFCGSPPVIGNRLMYCRICKDYKGIMPNCKT